MSDFSRRSFMQMLGLGGMALTIEASAPIPLFGSDDVKSLVAPDRSLLKGHLIVQKKGLTERIPEVERAKMSHRFGTPVARITRTQVPGGGTFDSLEEHKLFIPGEFMEGVDPHVVYYKASHKIREQFAAISRKRLLSVPPELRAGAILVTVAESPIMATSRHTWEDESCWHDKEVQGFDVVAYFRQGIRYSTKGLDTFNIYSETGEFPIDVPRDIDMSLLMKMDREILSDATLLVSDPRSWRPSGRTLRTHGRDFRLS